ncbi:MAG TPA: 30S ribosomal protein S20 [Tepidisphaeraceae bacterium]|nr:30S ribosomal protein S20 [Tepidisphaeraceae bacterium]
MAHSLSAKKRVRQNAKRRLHNRWRKDAIREQGKSFLSALAKGDAKTAGAELNKTVALMDRAATKHALHKNTVARKRSRLTKRLNALGKKTAAA